MKRLVPVLLGLAFVLPLQSFAATNTASIQAQIDAILQLISQLELELSQMSPATTTPATMQIDATPTFGSTAAPSAPVSSVFITVKQFPSKVHMGDTVRLDYTIDGAGRYPTIEVSTDNPNGFDRINGHTESQGAKVNDQTVQVSRNESLQFTLGAAEANFVFAVPGQSYSTTYQVSAQP